MAEIQETIEIPLEMAKRLGDCASRGILTMEMTTQLDDPRMIAINDIHELDRLVRGGKMNRQFDLDGNLHVSTGHPVRNQIAAIMEQEPETQHNEDLLAAVWLYRYGNITEDRVREEMGYPVEKAYFISFLAEILRKVRKADPWRRRRELRDDYPWVDEEEERRQKVARRGI